MKTDKEKLDEAEHALDNSPKYQILKILNNEYSIFSPFIQAIRKYRELTGASLREAKDFVDSVRNEKRTKKRR